MPYIYLILFWGNIIPSQDAGLRGIGDKVYLAHLGYASTIISFYLFPLLFFKKERKLQIARSEKSVHNKTLPITKDVVLTIIASGFLVVASSYLLNQYLY